MNFIQFLTCTTTTHGIDATWRTLKKEEICILAFGISRVLRARTHICFYLRFDFFSSQHSESGSFLIWRLGMAFIVSTEKGTERIARKRDVSVRVEAACASRVCDLKDGGPDQIDLY